MNTYYGVQRSTDHLAHYGVKGMRWGVRKAIEARNGARLTRHAKKASQKLARLKAKADIIRQTNEYKQYKDATKMGLAMAGTGAGIGGIAYGTGHFNPITAPAIGAVTGGGLGAAAGSGIHALVRRNRLSQKGHAKAVKKVRDWQKSMNESFKGTRYQNLAGPKYQDKYALDKAHYNPKTGKISRSRVAVFDGNQLTRDYYGKVTPKIYGQKKHKTKKHG